MLERDVGQGVEYWKQTVQPKTNKTLYDVELDPRRQLLKIVRPQSALILPLIALSATS